MKSKYKHAKKDEISHKLAELRDERFPFHQPVLQRDTFWIYCNARRYWGTYKNALNKLSIELESDEIKSELGYKIDWWEFVGDHNQREWLAIVLKYLSEKLVDISPKGLKNSTYFDLYTDAVILFGKYNVALEYANVSKDMARRITYPDNDDIVKSTINIYCDTDHRKKCECLKSLDIDMEKNIEILDQNPAEHMIIVDGANVAYVRNKPSLEHIKLLDNYLQRKGFRKDNIVFIYDAAFRYRVDAQKFDEFIRKDKRHAIAPAGEQADAHILTKALELLKKNPNLPPYIISNDQYKTYFEKYAQFEELKSSRKGVTWAFVLKKPEPVISLFCL